MQAFWVRVAAGNATGSLTFDNTMRSHKGVIMNRLKAPAVTNSVQQVLRLQVSNGVNSDEAIILFNPNASNGFDDYDSPKMTNANASIPEIYTLSGTEQVVINGLKSVETSPVLALGFTTGQENSFTIKASEISNFDVNTKIMLKDNVLHTEQELTLGVPYAFKSSIISNADRFSLIFRTPSITTQLNLENENAQITVYKVDNRIVIQNKGVVNKDAVVTICNAIGQKLVTKQLLTDKTTIETHLETGVYFVTVRAGDRTTTKKILID
jgi:hypothetical protein